MDFEGLKAFLAVAELGSFSLAADRLHLTQPAVSKRVAHLEDGLGLRLFDRIGRTVSLTEAGRELQPRAGQILASVEDSRRALSNLAGSVSGHLSLATSHHIGLWRMPEILRNFTRQYPAVTLDLHFMDSEVAHEQILQGAMELGVITLAPAGHDRLCSTPVWKDELVFVCARDHDLARVEAVDLEILAGHPAVLPDMSTFTGRIVKQLFQDRGLSLTTAMSTNYLETIKMLITVGLGWSVLPRTMLDPGICSLRVPGVSINRDLGVIHHIHRSLSNAGNAFIDLLKAAGDASVVRQ